MILDSAILCILAPTLTALHIDSLFVGMSKVFNINALFERTGRLHKCAFNKPFPLEADPNVLEHLQYLYLLGGPYVEVVADEETDLEAVGEDLEHTRGQAERETQPLDSDEKREVQVERYPQHDLTESEETVHVSSKTELPQEKLQQDHNGVGDHTDQRDQNQD